MNTRLFCDVFVRVWISLVNKSVKDTYQNVYSSYKCVSKFFIQCKFEFHCESRVVFSWGRVGPQASQKGGDNIVCSSPSSLFGVLSIEIVLSDTAFLSSCSDITSEPWNRQLCRTDEIFQQTSRKGNKWFPQSFQPGTGMRLAHCHH